jgi:TRAP-type C4-dicarboxylate transport system permease small subunit
MQLISRLLSSASYLLVALGGAGAFVTMMVVSVDVTLRMFGAGIPGTLEIVTYYLMSMVAFLPLARVERLEATISVDMLFTSVGRRVQVLLLVLVAAISTVIYGIIAYFTWIDALKHQEIGSYILTDRYPLPIWPAYYLVPAAFGLAALITLLRLAEVVAGTYRPHGGEAIDDIMLDVAVLKTHQDRAGR